MAEPRGHQGILTCSAKIQSALRNEPVDGRRAARAQTAGGPAGGVRDPPDVGTSSAPPQAPAQAQEPPKNEPQRPRAAPSCDVAGDGPARPCPRRSSPARGCSSLTPAQHLPVLRETHGRYVSTMGSEYWGAAPCGTRSTLRLAAHGLGACSAPRRPPRWSWSWSSSRASAAF